MESGVFLSMKPVFARINLDDMRFYAYNRMYSIMGYPNLAWEEADVMAKKSERSLLLVCMLFVFVCLLLSGGSRLIGSEIQEKPMQLRPPESICAELSRVIAQRIESSLVIRREHSAPYIQVTPERQDRMLSHRALSDANGNILGSRTYMRSVYQSFALGDGFV